MGPDSCQEAEPEGGAKGRSQGAEPEGGAEGRSRRAEPRGGAEGRSRRSTETIHTGAGVGHVCPELGFDNVLGLGANVVEPGGLSHTLKLSSLGMADQSFLAASA